MSYPAMFGYRRPFYLQAPEIALSDTLKPLPIGRPYHPLELMSQYPFELGYNHPFVYILPPRTHGQSGAQEKFLRMRELDFIKQQQLEKQRQLCHLEKLKRYYMEGLEDEALQYENELVYTGPEQELMRYGSSEQEYFNGSSSHLRPKETAAKSRPQGASQTLKKERQQIAVGRGQDSSIEAPSLQYGTVIETGQDPRLGMDEIRLVDARRGTDRDDILAPNSVGSAEASTKNQDEHLSSNSYNQVHPVRSSTDDKVKSPSSYQTLMQLKNKLERIEADYASIVEPPFIDQIKADKKSVSMLEDQLMQLLIELDGVDIRIHLEAKTMRKLLIQRIDVILRRIDVLNSLFVKRKRAGNEGLTQSSSESEMVNRHLAHAGESADQEIGSASSTPCPSDLTTDTLGMADSGQSYISQVQIRASPSVTDVNTTDNLHSTEKVKEHLGECEAS